MMSTHNTSQRRQPMVPGSRDSRYVPRYSSIGSRLWRVVTEGRNSAAAGTNTRTGATLTEVLMALLVMGVGIVSVATLFPLSLMKAIHATKLTNATILRFNAETWLEMQGLEPIKNPDGVGLSPDTGLASERFVIDPLGWNLIVDPSATDITNRFADSTAPIIPRFNFNLVGDTAAASAVTLPDSFTEGIEAIHVTGPPTNEGEATFFVDTLTGSHRIAFPSSVGFTTLGSADNLRVTIFNEDGDRSVSVDGLSYPAANTIELAGTVPGPFVEDIDGDGTLSGTYELDWDSDGIDFDIGRIIVEIRERRYTWMMFVRRNDATTGNADIELAVFFRRGFVGTQIDEFIYTNLTEPSSTSQAYTLTWNDSTDPTPWIKRGSWFFDLDDFRWVQIDRVESESAGQARFYVTGDHIIPTEPGRTKSGRRIVVMRNVVDVYPFSVGG
ncbi:type IV pilus modification PilV family protein [Calycomorphotria hydatis]|uniref:Uncharacterized protein n=1 Tax=Calycomorphotria hydatis TaxID=2528027 RepID=A0A517T5V2_9PLAN|nr:hypothetical protein [Calycomorphotria hydatis]QDT63757.1 hypothetical protein V22_09820 [Calycomorphotria hydatis]